VRIVAIDFGSKRTGLAVTDPLQIIATSLDTVDTFKLIEYLEQYCKTEAVEGFVFGLSKKLDNSMNDIHKSMQVFQSKLKEKFPEKYIEEMDERYTSKMAQQSILMSGVNKKTRQDKSLIDKVSAAILLQDYLNFKQR
jgi:putative Holliday junction resolvase